MGLNAVRCESYSGILEAVVTKASGNISADDFSLGQDAKEKLMYAAAISAGIAWAGYWLLSTPTYSEMCGHNNGNNQSNVTENTTLEKEDVRCKKDDAGGIAVPPLLYVHYP